MDTNAHYADYFGVILGDVIRGNAHNIVDHTWRWKVKLTSDPTVVVVPDGVNRTVHDDHVRARLARTQKPTPKKRTKAAKPKKPAKPLPRKTPLKRKTKLVAKPKRRR